MSTVTLNPPRACDVCGQPATAVRAIFADDHSPLPTPASVTEAYCPAHVPAAWHLDEPRTLEPPDGER